MSIHQALERFGSFQGILTKINELDIFLQKESFTRQQIDELFVEIGINERFRRCETCKVFFKPQTVVQKYCTAQCRNHAAYERAALRGASTPIFEKVCAHCGEAFAPQRRWQEFCSTRCRVAAHRAGRIAS